MAYHSFWIINGLQLYSDTEDKQMMYREYFELGFRYYAELIIQGIWLDLFAIEKLYLTSPCLPAMVVLT